MRGKDDGIKLLLAAVRELHAHGGQARGRCDASDFCAHPGVLQVCNPLGHQGQQTGTGRSSESWDAFARSSEHDTLTHFFFSLCTGGNCYDQN